MGVVVGQGTGLTLAESRERERAENFPVALRLLPREPRQDLHAVYAVARLIDDTGDDPDRSTGERLAALDALEADLLHIWADALPVTPAFRALAPTVARRRLPAEPFQQLVEANRRDQTTTFYATFDELRDYCGLSANPVGRIVLSIAGDSTSVSVRFSDRVCTALQVLEHCQDVGEDWRLRGRVYMPRQDMEPFGVTPASFESQHAGPGVRALVEFETERAAGLLADGAPLIGRLHGWARRAVAGYIAGGLATVDSLRRAEYDVLAVDVRPRPLDVARHALRLLVRGR